jgi:hypothetical protein
LVLGYALCVMLTGRAARARGVCLGQLTPNTLHSTLIPHYCLIIPSFVSKSRVVS